MRPQRAIAAAFLSFQLVIAVTASLTPAYACSCAVTAPTASLSPDAGITFLGRAQQFKPYPAETASTNMVAVGFVTKTDSDGALLGFVQVLTPASTDSCGYPFAMGKTYEVHARHDANGRLIADSCSATTLSSRQIEVVKYPYDPGPQAFQTTWLWRVAVPVLGVAVLVVAAGGLILVASRWTPRKR